jgi:uncharacterized protein (TIGR03435 family)
MFPAFAFLICALSASPSFETATVTPNSSPNMAGAQMQVLPGGKVVIKNVPLLMIVAAAWDIPFQSPRLTGGKEWAELRETKYDIEAAAPSGAIPTDLSPKERGNLIRPMMQALLEERFKLRMRRDAKEQPVYALVVSKDGPTLEKAAIQEKDCAAAASGGQSPCHRIGGGKTTGIHGDAVGIDDIVLFVQNWTDHPLIDRTGLTDLYKVQTDAWTGSTPAAIFAKLGLVLEPQQAAIDMFVVENVQKPAVN